VFTVSWLCCGFAVCWGTAVCVCWGGGGGLYVTITKVTQHIAGILPTQGEYTGMLLHDAA
jgi:hypothetical protein